MKKFLVLIGAAVLVMALASPSIAQFKSWGHMEIQTIWLKKPDFNTGQQWQAQAATGKVDLDETWRHIAERFRFYLQYGDPKTVRAVIGFEADSSDWGESKNTDAATISSGGKMGVYRADQVQLEIKHAFLDFTIPGTPLTLTAGIQPYAYGGRLFMNNDAPGLTLTAAFAPHKIQAFWWRENDTARNTYQVNDTYGVAWDMSQKLFNIYAYGAYKNDLQSATYADHPYWIGVGGGFRPGNFDISAQVVYNGGTKDYVTGTDKDYKAWAAEAAVKYRIGPGMFVGLEGFYSTGNDADKTDEINLYQVPTGSESQSIFGNDRTVFFWMNASQIGYYHERNLAFMGMWYGRANFEYSPLPWLRFNLNYLYIGDTSKGTADGTKTVNSPLGARKDKDEDYVGSELNLITNITIYPGFVYNIGIYYFSPGDVYDTATKSADASYGINTKLVYSF